jgi:hypothetical protein
VGHFERAEEAYAPMEGVYASLEDAYAHLVRFGLLDFGLSLGSFQIFSRTHYSKLFLIDKSSIIIGTRDSRYW